MTSTGTDQEVLDRALDDLLAGRRAIADCLSEWPHLRDSLEPLLQVAAAFPAPDPLPLQPAPERREAFMRLIRETAQQSPRRSLALPQMSRPRSSVESFATLRAGALRLAAGAGAVAVVGVLVAVALLVPGGTRASAATLTVLAGGVEQLLDNGTWAPVTSGAHIAPGTTLRTTDAGYALLQLTGTTAVLDPRTQVRLHAVDEGEPALLDLSRGRVWVDVAAVVPAANGGAAGAARAAVRVHGTSLATGDASFEVSAADGQVTVTVDRGEVVASRGQASRGLALGRYLIGGAAGDEISPAPMPGGVETLTVHVPGDANAQLFAPSGASTGAGPGRAPWAILGSVVSGDEDGRRIAIRGPLPGEYRLLIEDIAAEQETVVVELGGVEHRLPVPPNARGLEVAISVGDGATSPRLRVLEALQERADEGPPGGRPPGGGPPAGGPGGGRPGN